MVCLYSCFMKALVLCFRRAIGRGSVGKILAVECNLNDGGFIVKERVDLNHLYN